MLVLAADSGAAATPVNQWQGVYRVADDGGLVPWFEQPAGYADRELEPTLDELRDAVR